MIEIPDDVRVELAKEYVRQNFESGEPWSTTIARAILAERERCAKVAETFRRKKLRRDISKATFDPCGRWDGGEIYEEGKEKQLIASRIRLG